MGPLRKIPLEMLINILEDLYNGGADYVDISGDADVDGTPRDTIKITVRPEYLSTEEDTAEDIKKKFDISKPLDLSDENINDLI
jgi:hypothetical protein